MDYTGLTLVIPEKADVERDGVAAAWEAVGGTVLRLGRFWDPPELAPGSVRVYANDTFALVLAQKLGLALVSPPDDLLLGLPADQVGRKVDGYALAAMEQLRYPLFAKSAVPKLFSAAIYRDHAALLAQTAGLAPDTRVLVSEIVSFTCEARAFILRGEVRDLALYEGETADLDGARVLARTVAACPALPEACVIDLGYIAGRGWAVVEANAAWGAGLNGCAADRVLPCIAAATRVA